MEGEVAGGASLLADGRRTTIGGACLANAALFHGRAQEDTCGAGHFGTVLIPLLTAIIEVKRLSTAELIPALVAGYEAGGLVEQALARSSTPAGFRSTSVYGTVAAAAASARLLGLDERQTASALETAVSFTGGVLQSFADGSDEWRYQPGIFARNGWTAMELARAGANSAPGAFEGKSGLAQAFARSTIDADALAVRLGNEWSIRRVTFKPASGLRIQPDSGHRRARAAGANWLATDRRGARADEPVRDRLRRHGRHRSVPFHLRHLDEHPILHRNDLGSRRSVDGADDRLWRLRGQRARKPHQPGDRLHRADLVGCDRG
jgi:hypothetical protein